jgi:glycerol-3-phosphate dehydrogenase
MRNELATTLSDVYLRQTMLGLRGDLGLDTLGPVTELTRTRLGWTGQRAVTEATEYRQAVTRRYRSLPSSKPLMGEQVGNG